MDIKGFQGEHRWLSNFWKCNIVFKNTMFKSSENAYQASKATTKEMFDKFIDISPAEAKKLGKIISIIADFKSFKLDIMYEIVSYKFNNNEDLKIKLIETKECYIEETNVWGDTFWGVYNGKGSNNLGKIIMKVRSEIFHSKIFSEF